jgi:hypothetical protein
LVTHVAKSDALRKFLQTPTKSSVLAIHANLSDVDTVTPLSFLDAHLMKLLLSSEKSIVLAYFCSLHAEVGSPRANARGLVASLVGQLLDYPSLRFNLSFIDEEMTELLKGDDLVQLVQLFLCLLQQLPSDAAVFCFIDEVTFYETSERKDETRTLLVTFVKQVINKQRDMGLPVFKLLLTDGRSSMVGKIIGEENVLDVLEDFGKDNDDPEDAILEAFE